MSRATCKQFAAVLALLATLSMIAPAPAQAASRAAGGKAPRSSGLTWLSSLWDHLASLICDEQPLDGSYIHPDG
jgi:hypothetical protein